MKRMTRVVMIIVVAAFGGTTAGDIIDLSGVPDLSQHAITSPSPWVNYCAPTAGANVAYYFSQTHSLLRQGDSLPGTVAGANNIIAGGGLLPPGPGSMADLMNTSTTSGTTALNLRDGLDTYFEDRWDGVNGGSDWDTQYVAASSLANGNAFWNRLQDELRDGSGVILLIAWLGTVPDGYDVPDGYTPDTGDSSPLGHAVTMSGFNIDLPTHTMTIRDPANNGGTHSFSPSISADTFNVTVNASDISLNFGSSTANIYGAVVTNIPAPGALALLSVGGYFGLARRRRLA